MRAYLPDAELRRLLGQIRFDRVTTKTVSSHSRLPASRKQAIIVVDSGTVAGIVSVAEAISRIPGFVGDCPGRDPGHTGS